MTAEFAPREGAPVTAWIVGHNMAGYMPGSENHIMVGPRRAAISAALADARFNLEALNDGLWGMTPEDRREYRYRLSGRRGDYWLTAQRGASYHYWYAKTSLAPVTVVAPERWARCYCDSCERSLEHREPAWEGDGYVLCDDCIA